MLDLVRKRHDGDGWLVFTELGNAPGYPNARADAVALGVWASNKYEAHLYEFKISREDLKRELRDPAKGDAVGNYCHYRWLAVSDQAVLNDLVIPEIWGIVIPTGGGASRRFKVVRKAPRLKPKVFGPHFAVSMIRNMSKTWVAPADHARVRDELDALRRGQGQPPRAVEDANRDQRIRELEATVKDLRDGIESFRQESGVELPASRWQYGRIGSAVKVVLDHGAALVRGDIGAEVNRIATTAEIFEGRARELAQVAIAMRKLMTRREHDPACRSRGTYSGPCTCGTEPLSTIERQLSLRSDPDDPAQDDPCATTSSNPSSPSIPDLSS